MAVLSLTSWSLYHMDVSSFLLYTFISRSCHFEIESEAPVGRIAEVQIENMYQPEAAAAI